MDLGPSLIDETVAAAAPPARSVRVTEAGDRRITEAGDVRVQE